MCHKCNWIEVDGIQAHINGDVKDPETLDALKKMIKIVRNYEKMKAISQEQSPKQTPPEQQPFKN